MINQLNPRRKLNLSLRNKNLKKRRISKKKLPKINQLNLNRNQDSDSNLQNKSLKRKR